MGVAKEIVSVVDMVAESETEEGNSEGCNFLRVWVVNPSDPLCKGRKIGRKDGSASWVSFKYERLPNIYYWCGKLTHHDKDCPSRLKKKETVPDVEKQFGSWLRTSTPNPSRWTVIHVAGFEEEDDEVSNTKSSNTVESEVDKDNILLEHFNIK